MSQRLDFAAAPSFEEARTVLLGAPLSGAGFSESARGQAGVGPEESPADAIRRADNESPSLCECLEDGAGLFDAGNLELEGLGTGAQLERATQALLGLLGSGRRVIALGGDHLLKAAALEAVGATHPGCGVLYVDAHPDCEEAPLSFRSILHHAWNGPSHSPARTSLVGLRQVNARERAGLRRWQPGIVPATDFVERGMAAVVERVLAQLGSATAVYVSVDLDGLALADAPAVEAPYPGGPSLRELLALLRAVAHRLPLVGMDITEFLPQFDPTRITALTGARLVKEFHCLSRAAS